MSDTADPYVDDIIIGSTGDTEEELLRNHDRDLREVLDLLEDAELVADPRKAKLFMREVEIVGMFSGTGNGFQPQGNCCPSKTGNYPLHSPN